MGCIVGERGLKWEMHVGPGWQGSSHPATRVWISVSRMRSLELPRNLRTRARREAPADGACEVPPRPRRRRRAGGLARGDTGLAAMRLDLDPGRLRRVHRRDAQRPEPGLAEGARA